MLLQGSEMVKLNTFLNLLPFVTSFQQNLPVFLNLSQVSAAEERLGPMRLTQEPIQV